jgi:hypothetical protein
MTLAARSSCAISCATLCVPQCQRVFSNATGEVLVQLLLGPDPPAEGAPTGDTCDPAHLCSPRPLYPPRLCPSRPFTANHLTRKRRLAQIRQEPRPAVLFHFGTFGTSDGGLGMPYESSCDPSSDTCCHRTDCCFPCDGGTVQPWPLKASRGHVRRPPWRDRICLRGGVRLGETCDAPRPAGSAALVPLASIRVLAGTELAIALDIALVPLRR